MTNMLALARWEWFKLARRWMPWVLLILVVLLSQALLWGRVARYSQVEGQVGPDLGNGQSLNCKELEGADPSVLPPNSQAALGTLKETCAAWRLRHDEALGSLKGNFTLPGSLENALATTQALGTFMIAILTSSLIGTDYTWGTLRSVLSRGTGRWQYLGAKLVLALALVAATLGLVVAVTAVSSTLAGMLMSGPATPGESWADALESFGRAWVSLLPWVALAASMTVLTGSAAAGTAITMAYQFTEQLLVAVLTQLVDWFHNVADYFLGRNVSAWVQGNDPPGPESFIQGALPSQWHGLLVLLAYTAALSALAFFLFQRRDVKGPSGG